MKALVFKGIGNISIEIVNDPTIEHPQDAVVKITTSAICGTDLHMIRGTMNDMVKGTIMGHEGVGIVEQIGSEVTDINIGDRVIIGSTIGCGKCDYCQIELYSQCTQSNPNGAQSGTTFFGGPQASGPIQGMQAEKVRVPYADVNLVRIPDEILDEQVILLSDILPTAYMAVDMAHVSEHDTVAVFGCGPVGQLVIHCLKQKNVNKIFAIDRVPSRLEMAKKQGAHVINFDEVDPVQELHKLTNKQGPTRVIDAVGIDAQQQKGSLFSFITRYTQKKQFKNELKEVAPRINSYDGNWIPGDGPSQALQWAVDSVAHAGTVSIIGVYSSCMRFFPIGNAFGKNITIRMGNCNHRKYIPLLLEWVKNGSFDSRDFVTQTLPLDVIVDAYHHFDKREENWIKVILKS